MKSFLVASTALLALTAQASAADMPLKAPPLAVAPVFNWSGFYVGGHVGGDWGTTIISSFSDIFQSGRYRVSGVSGGGQAGFNFLIAPNIVLGWEADVSGSSLSGKTTTTPPQPTVVVDGWKETNSVFGTVRGRLGYVQSNWLFYGTGGFAWASDKLARTQLAANIFSPPLGSVFTNNGTRTGWTAGGGVEWRFARNWSAKFEYLFMDFAGRNFNFADVTHPLGVPCAGGNICVTEGRLKLDTINVGLNYFFN